MIIGIPFDRVQRTIFARLEISIHGIPYRDGARIHRLSGSYDGWKRSALVKTGNLLLRRRPIVGVERGKEALGFGFAPEDLGVFGEVSAAPDGAFAGIRLLLFFAGGLIGIRFLAAGRVAGTIAGVAAIDFQVVGADGDRHEPDCSTAARRNWHMCLLHARLFFICY